MLKCLNLIDVAAGKNLVAAEKLDWMVDPEKSINVPARLRLAGFARLFAFTGLGLLIHLWLVLFRLSLCIQ